MGTEGDPASLWLAAINADGVVEWQRRLASSTYDVPMEAVQAIDGAWVIAATVADVAIGERDWWLLKMTTRGNLDWQISLQTDFDDAPAHLAQLPDGRLLVSGHTASFATPAAGRDRPLVPHPDSSGRRGGAARGRRHRSRTRPGRR